MTGEIGARVPQECVGNAPRFWISSPDAGPQDRTTLYLRRGLELSAPVVQARAVVTALGWYRLFVNGEDLTGPALVPRWTPFDTEIEYQVYDVTATLREGRNVVGVVVADGRYRGTMGFDMLDARYGERLGVLLQITADLADGTQVVLESDETWQVGRGRIRSADPMTGEVVDLRIGQDTWLDLDVPMEAQAQAEVLPVGERRFIGEDVPRVAEIGRRPGRVSRAPSGAQLVDFGQNFAGVAALRLRGRPGSTVTIRYSEVLTPDGELDTTYVFEANRMPPLADRYQSDRVTLGGAPEVYCPWFTIRGFRYVSVEGAEPLADDDVTGIVLSTDMAQVAQFEVSDPRLERLWKNALWSARSNFTDTATDCPTRERSGWTGDIQVFASTAVQLLDCDAFLRRYLHNLAIEQYPDGRVPPYVPSERSASLGPHPMEYVSTSVGWGDAAVMVPWVMYTYLGDRDVLAAQWRSAQAWVDQMAHRAATTRGLVRRLTRRSIGADERFILDTGFHWGEWLRPGEGNTWLKSKIQAPAVVATAYFAHSARLLSQMAQVLGRRADAERYAELSDRVGRAWRMAFVSSGGARIGEDKQDDYVRALAFDLLPPHARPAATGRLVELIERAGDHVGTGFLSTPMLLPTLADAGRPDVAYRLLFQDTPPSWLAQVAQGATTIWEKWEGYNADGTAHDSHNHYAFGSIARFLHEYVAGVSPLEPGYRRIRFAPLVTDRLDHAGVRLQTPAGEVASRWQCTAGGVELTVTVPPGATGVVVAGGTPLEVGPGTHTLAVRV